MLFPKCVSLAMVGFICVSYFMWFWSQKKSARWFRVGFLTVVSLYCPLNRAGVDFYLSLSRVFYFLNGGCIRILRTES